MKHEAVRIHARLGVARGVADRDAAVGDIVDADVRATLKDPEADAVVAVVDVARLTASGYTEVEPLIEMTT